MNSKSFFPENYRTIARELVELAKQQESRDNISVIVVYLKEPKLIATQSWPAAIQLQQSRQMENVFEQQPAESNGELISNSAITIDALGNPNQVKN